MREAPGERGVAVARQADRFCGEGGVFPLEHAMVQTRPLLLQRQIRENVEGRDGPPRTKTRFRECGKCVSSGMRVLHCMIM